jgi:hypothetical protein
VRSKGNEQGGHDAASGDWSGSRARVICSASVCSDEGASCRGNAIRSLRRHEAQTDRIEVRR